MLEPKDRLSIDLHSPKAIRLMHVTPSGISTDVSGQPLNAAEPIDVMVEGRVTDSRLVQLLRKSSGTSVMPSGRLKLFRAMHPEKAPFPNLITLFRLMDVSALHSEKVPQPMESTEAGKESVCREVQPLNAQLPISLTPSAIVNELRLLAPEQIASGIVSTAEPIDSVPRAETLNEQLSTGRPKYKELLLSGKS